MRHRELTVVSNDNIIFTGYKNTSAFMLRIKQASACIARWKAALIEESEVEQQLLLWQYVPWPLLMALHLWGNAHTWSRCPQLLPKLSWSSCNQLLFPRKTETFCFGGFFRDLKLVLSVLPYNSDGNILMRYFCQNGIVSLRKYTQSPSWFFYHKNNLAYLL